MAYTIRNTRSQVVATVADGSVDSTTNIRLIGKNYVGYGTALNENLIGLLENFASISAPSKPVTGMLWYNTTTDDLYVYNSSNSFVPAIKSASNFAVTSNLSAGNISVTGTVTSTTFNGNLSGNVTGRLTGNVTGNLSGNVTGNLNGNVTATTIAGNLTTAAQPNITSLGNLTTLTVNGNTSLARTGGAVAIGAAVSSTAIVLDVVAPAGPGIIQLSGTGLAAGRLTVDAGLDFNVINTSNGKLNLGASNNVHMTMLASGNVGIGNTSPSHNLSVTGTMNVSGNANVGNLGTARVVATSTLSVTGNANVGNLGTATAIITTGNITTINSGSMRNGNSNVTITANSNITLNVTAANSYTFATGSFAPNGNGTQQLGLTGARWSNIWGLASSAQYADLAEKYHSDQEYPYGTVMSLGGAFEVTKSITDADDKVFGVVSKDPAYLMNDADQDGIWLPIVLTGRSPVMVTGKVVKGGWLVSAGDGTARAAKEEEIHLKFVIGRSLVDKTDDKPKLVEAYISTK